MTTSTRLSISAIAAFFHEVLPTGPSTAVTSGNPVVILSGLNHWNFASGDDNPPPNVKKNDIKSEKTAAEGHAEIASTVSNFLDTHFAASASARSSAAANLTAAVENTGTILSPLLEAMHQEAHQHLIEPCDSDFPTNPTCQVLLHSRQYLTRVLLAHQSILASRLLCEIRCFSMYHHNYFMLDLSNCPRVQYPKWPDKSLGPPARKPNPLPPTNCVCGRFAAAFTTYALVYAL